MRVFNKIKISFITIAELFLFYITANSQEMQEKKWVFELDLTTEGQFNLSKPKANWVSLLYLHFDFNPWKNGSFVLETNSIYNLLNEELISDGIPVFSNIDNESVPLSLYLTGYAHSFGNVSLFGGLRNVDGDFFSFEYSSVFINSPCGLFPPVGENFPVATYPTSAMCIHGEVAITDHLIFKNSLYNGVSRMLFNDENHSVFSVNPKKDGIFNITGIGYADDEKSAFYNAGLAVKTSYTEYSDEDQPEKIPSGYAFWINAEQRIFNARHKEIAIVAHASYAPSNHLFCNQYFGGGTVLQGFLSHKNQNRIGLFASYIKLEDISEKILEITCNYNIRDIFSIQPVFQYILINHTNNFIGVLRLNYSFGL